MLKALIRACVFVAAAASFPNVATAAEKLPSAYDDRRDSAIDTGHQNMPFQLLGVSIKWDRECRSGKLDQCMKLAEAFETGLGDLKQEIRVSLGYYRLACAKGEGAACARAATIIRDGSANFVNLPMAFQAAERGCTLRSQEACASLGLHHYRGAGTAVDRARATQLWDAACAAGADDGCRLKAGALFFESGDAAQQRAAVPLFDAACKAKRAWGCHGLATALREGKGIGANAAAAADAARKGCLEGTGAKVAVCGIHGVYVAASSDKAALNLGEKLLDRACTAGDAESCAAIGTIGFERRPGATTTPPEALFYLRRGCDRGSGLGCAGLASAYESGFQVGRDSAAAFLLNRRACTLGHQGACAKAQGSAPSYGGIDPTLTSDEQLRLAREAATGSGDRIKGFNTVVRLMQEGDEEASWLLGGWLYYGLPGVMDTSRRSDGVILIENAARVGHVDAAVWAGMAYWYGDGVGEDRAKGEKYMAIAAQRGSEMAAAIYRSMKNEPVRQEMAARAKAAEEAAATRRTSWQSSWSSWTPSFSTPASSSGNWQSFESIRDTSNFNQFVSAVSNRTACPSSNPYC
jgi:TPR repeat protein